jgi:hypothetical protein
MRSLVSISCAVISTLRTQIEALDLDLAADHPEGVPARRQPLQQPALDLQQTRLMVLDIDPGRDLPVDPDLPGRHQMRRTTVEADDGDLMGLGLHHLEQSSCEIRNERAFAVTLRPASLRGAQRRSNPAVFSGKAGLLRCARNDGTRIENCRAD